MVKVEVDKGQKARYSAPKLVIYGDMAKFTAAGTGSMQELGAGVSTMRFP